jgi:uncharacterized protein
MSEQSNSDLVLAMYAAFSRGDSQFIIDNVADDIEWITYGPSSIPYAGTFKGKAGVARFFQLLESTQQNQRLTTDKVIAQGDTVATVGRYSATVKATGKSADTPIAHIFTLRGGKVSRFLDFFDTAVVAAAYAGKAASA